MVSLSWFLAACAQTRQLPQSLTTPLAPVARSNSQFALNPGFGITFSDNKLFTEIPCTASGFNPAIVAGTAAEGTAGWSNRDCLIAYSPNPPPQCAPLTAAGAGEQRLTAAQAAGRRAWVLKCFQESVVLTALVDIQLGTKTVDGTSCPLYPVMGTPQGEILPATPVDANAACIYPSNLTLVGFKLPQW